MQKFNKFICSKSTSRDDKAQKLVKTKNARLHLLCIFQQHSPFKLENFTYYQTACLLWWGVWIRRRAKKEQRHPSTALFFLFLSVSCSTRCSRVKRIRKRIREKKFFQCRRCHASAWSRLKQPKAFKLTRKKFQKILKLLKACHCHISWTFLLKWILLHFFSSFLHLSLITVTLFSMKCFVGIFINNFL